MAEVIIRFILLVIVGELILHILFLLLSKLVGKTVKDKVSRTSIIKGVLERGFIVVSLYFNVSQALTLLGALKIATRIKDTEDKVSNDFFLIGNLTSVLVSILYFVLLQHLLT